MNAAQDEARSARLRARMGRGPGTVGDDGDDESACADSRASASRVGFIKGAIVFGAVGVFVGFMGAAVLSTLNGDTRGY